MRVAVPATGGNAARVTAGSLQVRSRPFAPHWLTVAVSDAGSVELILRLCSSGPHNGEALAGGIAALKKLGCQIKSRQQTGAHLRLVVRSSKNLKTISDALLAVPGLDLEGTVDIYIPDVCGG